MVITWYGESCFKIQTGETALLTDPFSAQGGSASGGEYGAGLTPPRLKADIVLKTLTEFPLPYEASPETHVFAGPGEYEIKGVEITGWQMHKESTTEEMKSVFLVKAEELRLGFLGHIAEMPDADVLERLGEVDVLFVPAGGAPHLNPEKAAKLCRQISPRIAVATLFKTRGLARRAGDVKEFLSELELKAEPQEKLVVKKRDLPQRLTVHVPTF